MRTLTLGLTLMVCHPGQAKPHVPPRPSSQSQPAAQRFEDFDDEVIETSQHGPQGEAVGGRVGVKSPSLIRVRQDFRPEMLRSAETI
jgi:hypothetical protein